MKLSVAMLLVPVLLLSLATSGPSDDAGACLARDQMLERISCLTDLADRAGNAGLCLTAGNEGVRWQCTAILAERWKDPKLCRAIPIAGPEYQDLRDVCLSDVARVRDDAALCSGIRAQTLRASCYQGVARE